MIVFKIKLIKDNLMVYGNFWIIFGKVLIVSFKLKMVF